MDEDALSGMTIRRTSTAEQVAEALRAAILDGTLPLGAPLREVELAQSFSVSRNTVRECFRLLVNEGLVTHHMHRGASVARLDRNDVAEIYRIRRLLEMSALSLRAPAPELMTNLEGALVDLDRAAANVDQQGIVEADLLFHRRIVALHESQRLDRFFQNIQAGIRLCLSILSHVDREYLDAPHVAEMHREIYKLFASGSREAARTALGRHLDVNEARLTEIVELRDQLHVDEESS
jgi:DNA-binding GntR family transcriptional regulator